MVKRSVKSYKYNLAGDYDITYNGEQYIFRSDAGRITVPKKQMYEFVEVNGGIDDISKTERSWKEYASSFLRGKSPISSTIPNTTSGGKRRKTTHRRSKKRRTIRRK